MDREQERQLVEHARTMPEAFGELFEIYYPKILRYAVHRTGNAEAARDITSETFFKALKNLRKFEWRSCPFSSWLYRIASNEVGMYFRRRKYQPVLLKTALAAHHLPGLEERNDVRAELAETQAIIDRNLEFAQIRAALCRLPPIYQEALVLKFLEEKTISEISGILGKNCNTVKSLIFRGLSCLRGFLPPPAFPDPGFPRKRTSMEVANHEREIEKPQI